MVTGGWKRTPEKTPTVLLANRSRRSIASTPRAETRKEPSRGYLRTRRRADRTGEDDASALSAPTPRCNADKAYPGATPRRAESGGAQAIPMGWSTQAAAAAIKSTTNGTDCGLRPLNGLSAEWAELQGARAGQEMLGDGAQPGSRTENRTAARRPHVAAHHLTTRAFFNDRVVSNRSSRATSRGRPSTSTSTSRRGPAIVEYARVGEEFEDGARSRRHGTIALNVRSSATPWSGPSAPSAHAPRNARACARRRPARAPE